MKKIAVVYWSGTGNTEAMAKAIVNGVEAGGGECSLFTASEFSEDLVGNYDVLVFGCPAMGAEMLEDGEFEPMFEACKPALEGKAVALFGSYDWGGGEWMDIWKEDCSAFANVVCEPLTVQNTPDDEALASCNEFGKGLC